MPLEYFGMLVSSHREKLKYKTNAKLNKNISNGLIVDGIVKCDCIYNIPSRNIQFKIGQVDIDDYMRFIEIYKEVLSGISKKLENV